MTIEIGLTTDRINTYYAPLGVLAAHSQHQHLLDAFLGVQLPLRERDYSVTDKLMQILTSILAGCATVSEVNLKLASEIHLAHAWGWSRFADQSNLSRTLDAFTVVGIDQLRQAATRLWRAHGQTGQHDWRAFLWLDFDLSGLPCSARAEESQKGYFSGKKTARGAS